MLPGSCQDISVYHICFFRHNEYYQYDLPIYYHTYAPTSKVLFGHHICIKYEIYSLGREHGIDSPEIIGIGNPLALEQVFMLLPATE